MTPSPIRLQCARTASSVLLISSALALSITIGAPASMAQRPSLRIAADLEQSSSVSLENRVGPGFGLGSDTLLAVRDARYGSELFVLDPAGQLRLVKDINPGTASSSPLFHIQFGSKVLFSAFTATNGRELWESDGSARGTRLAVELAPGTASSAVTNFVRFGAKLWFRASASTTGHELWTWDGNAATPVAPLLPKLTAIESLYVAQNKLWFTAARSDQSTSLRALYVSDGTAAGTRRLTDPNVLRLSGLPGITRLGTKGVVFSARTGSLNAPVPNLWFSDGVAAPQRLTQNSKPSFLGTTVLADLGSRVLFQVHVLDSQSVVRPEVWGTDGTPAGTQLLLTTVGSLIVKPHVQAGRAYFEIQGSIWESDATPIGTRITKRFRSLLEASSSGLVLKDAVGGRYFCEFSGTERKITLPAGGHVARGRSGRGEALIASDAGLLTVDRNGVRTVALPQVQTRHSYARGLMRVGDALIATASRQGDTWRLYALDPKSSIVSASSVEADGFGIPFVLFRGALYGRAPVPRIGTELRVLEPRSLRPIGAFDINNGSGSSMPESFVATRARIYFVADLAAGGHGLYTTDALFGKADALPVQGRGISLHKWGESVLAQVDLGAQGNELWISGGTPATTKRLLAASSLRVGARRATDVLVLRSTGANPAEVLRVDALGKATVLTQGIDARSRLHSVVLDDDFVFGTRNGLYVSDGTSAGTTQLRSDWISGLTRVGVDQATFLAGATIFTPARVLGLTDGTKNGTRNRLFGANFNSVVSHGSRWISAVAGGRSGPTYLLDTANTTYLRFEIDRRAYTSSQAPLIGGSMFFAAEDSVYGREIFRIDGLGALAVPAGIACGRGTRAMQLSSDAPRIGKTARLQVRQAGQASSVLLAIGSYSYEGFAGPDSCRIHVDIMKPLLLVPLAAAQGKVDATIAIPNSPALRGIEIALQGFAAQAQGLEATAALLWQLGS